MKWFDKKKPGEIWEGAVESPLGDIEAAERVRNICRSAAASAERAVSLANNRKKSAQKLQKVESDRYERAAKAAMQIAMKMSDELMRDAAVREIVELCLKAHDLKTAKILFRAIQSPAIRDPVLRENPMLRP